MHILVIDRSNFPGEAERALAPFGNVVKRDFTTASSRQAFLQAVRDAEALVIPLAQRIDREVIDSAPLLKFIATVSTGSDHIDCRYAESRGIRVLSLKGETEFLRTIHSTAEHTWALLLALIRRLVPATLSVRRGEWNRDPYCGRELSEKSLGIVGLGRLGRMVATYGIAFQMAVLGFDPLADEDEWPAGVERKETLEQLLKESDVLTLHVHLTDETTGLIGESELDLLPDGAILVNTSRGAIVDEEAVVRALRRGRLAGAAVDVVIGEQEAGFESPLRRYARGHDNVVVTPHIGGLTKEARHKAEVFMAGKLADALADTG